MVTSFLTRLVSTRMRDTAAAVLAITVTLLSGIARSAFCSGSPDEQFYGLTGIQSVTVKAQFLDVDVTGADTSRVDMTVDTDRGPFASNNFRVLHDERWNHLDVWVETDWPFGGGRGALRFQVPRDVKLRVETVSGKISVRQLSGDCFLKSVSGQGGGRPASVCPYGRKRLRRHSYHRCQRHLPNQDNLRAHHG